MVQAKALTPACVCMWARKVLRSVKLFWHLLHTWGRSSLWTLAMCRLRLFRLLNSLLQTEQANSRTSECTVWKCRASDAFVFIIFPQMWHCSEPIV